MANDDDYYWNKANMMMMYDDVKDDRMNQATKLIDCIKDNTAKEITTSIPELAYWLQETVNDYRSSVKIRLV